MGLSNCYTSRCAGARARAGAEVAEPVGAPHERRRRTARRSGSAEAVRSKFASAARASARAPPRSAERVREGLQREGQGSLRSTPKGGAPANNQLRREGARSPQSVPKRQGVAAGTGGSEATRRREPAMLTTINLTITIISIVLLY